jgi:hypothetical protein
MKNYLEAIKAQMELDRAYWYALCNVLNSDDIPLYQNKTIYTASIEMFSQISGIPVEDINHFIYEQDFGTKTGKTIEEFLNQY